jgi:hypothetical protein
VFCKAYGSDLIGDVTDVLHAAVDRLITLVVDIKRFASDGSEAFQQHLDQGHDRLYLDDAAYIAAYIDAASGASQGID